MAILNYNNRIFYLNTRSATYALSLETETVRHLYWGRKIIRPEDFAGKAELTPHGFHSELDQTWEEFSGSGCLRYKETPLKLRFADGTRDTRWKVTGCDCNEDILEIVLQDEVYPLAVSLFYRVYDEEDIIERWVEIKNTGLEDIAFDRLFSAQFTIPGVSHDLLGFSGKWNGEFQLNNEKLGSGKTVYDSCRGITGHGSQPVFVIHDHASEEAGSVYYGALAYSGNFKVILEPTEYDFINILMGINDYDFGWLLSGGSSFVAPKVYFGYSEKGFSGMSHTLHRFSRGHFMSNLTKSAVLPVLYNSWEATEFDVNCRQQMELADLAASLGVEYFVMDDGWHGLRDSESRGLGDWDVNQERFPNGLMELIDHVHSLGMGFGIWVEPEMVNKDSELYRTHPDWVYQYGKRDILEARKQCVLNLTKPEVAGFILRFMDELLTKYPIQYIKWDMNRPVSEGISGCGHEQSFWHIHTLRLYDIWSRLRELHPDVYFESCASGGGRVDFGMLPLCEQYWPSDNTDAVDRLSIQHGYSYFYPIQYMRAWVTDCACPSNVRDVPLSFRLHSAMCGALGIGSNLKHLSENENKLIADNIRQYKAMRKIIQMGKVYRLKDHTKDGFHAVQYVHGSKSVLFAFLVKGRYKRNRFMVRLSGLEESELYEYKIQNQLFFRSGSYLVHKGIEIFLEGDYDSVILEFRIK